MGRVVRRVDNPVRSAAFALIVLAAIACGSTEPVQPTPDVPLFAEGEAEALVEAAVVARLADFDRFDCSEKLRTALIGLLLGTTTASYLGQRAWSVVSDPFELQPGATTTLEWKVYEFSRVVQPTNHATVSAMAC